jgi:exopolyphosphatase/guanosine-5'-triphosphate,3'-diphosphate pyrophosphatase
MVSALGVREGLLYSLLGDKEKKRDPLFAAVQGLNRLRSRSPLHAEELVEWTDRFMASSGLSETPDEKRLRHAGCLLGDIGWRAHPDYRGEQSLNVIAHATFLGVDHPGRAYLALSVFFRHVGLYDGELSPQVRELATPRLIDRARVLGATMRVAYLVSAAMPGVLPGVPLVVDRGKLKLTMRGKYAAFAGERVYNRLRQLARLIGREPMMIVEPKH